MKKATRLSLLVTCAMAVCFPSACRGEDVPLTTLEVPSARLWTHAAHELACQWEQDAVLVEVVVDFVVGSSSQVPLCFKFESPNRDQANLTVWCSREGCLSQEFEFGFDVQHCRAIGEGDWAVDAPDAVAIAQQNGLEQFLARDLVVNSAWLQRYPRCFGDRTVWVVGSVDLRTRESLTIRVDANTGDLIDASE